jgi:hypothetical protein
VAGPVRLARDRGSQLPRHDLLGFAGHGVSVAQALQRAGITFDRAPPDLMPADLAKKFGVLP